MREKRERRVFVLLPNKQHVCSTVRVKAQGHEVLSSVLRHLCVGNLHVFGLAVLRDNEYLFVDLDQKLSKYFGKRWSRGTETVPFIMFLRLRYYVEQGQLILSSTVLQLYYTELRQKVLLSQSRLQEALFFHLAAAALQAETGNQEVDDGDQSKRRCYFLPEDYFPSWLIKRRGRDFLLQHCPALHHELRALTCSQAVLQFIEEASGLQDGPVTFYRMRQKRELRNSILFGVAMKGVHIYQEVETKLSLLHEFSWTDIDRFTFQGSRFEVAAVGSLCLPKMVYFTHSAFHSKHIMQHLSDAHRFHIHTRDALRYIQQLQDTEASHLYKESYICDIASTRKALQNVHLTSSMSECSVVVGTSRACSVEAEEDEDGEEALDREFVMSINEPDEVFVDDPAELSWLAELVYGVSVDGPLVSPSSWAAVTMEMKQVLWGRANDGVSVDS